MVVCGGSRGRLETVSRTTTPDVEPWDLTMPLGLVLQLLFPRLDLVFQTNKLLVGITH